MRNLAFLPLVVAVLVGGNACRGGGTGGEPIDSGEYTLLDPEELQCSLEDYDYEAVIGEGGEAVLTGGNIGRFSCAGKEIPLRKAEFEDGFIVTQDFGRINIQGSSSLLSSGFALYVTDRQRAALKEYVNE